MFRRNLSGEAEELRKVLEKLNCFVKQKNKC